MLTLPENPKTCNLNSAKVISIICGRCGNAASRRGGLRFQFDVEQFLCRGCVESMEQYVFDDYARAQSLIIDGGLA